MSTSTLFERWPWDQQRLLTVTTLMAFVIVLMIFILFQRYGVYALFTLFTTPTIIIYFIKNNRIRKKVAVLKSCKSAQNGEVVDSMLLFNRRPSPGVAIMRENEMVLIPIDGRRRKLQLPKVISIQSGNSLPGIFLLKKTVITLEMDNTHTLRFIVPFSTGRRWTQQLTTKINSH